MGIDLNGAQLLMRAHRSGVSFERVATLGRQRLLGDRQSLVSVLRASGYELSKDCVRKLLDPTTEYCEEFLRLLGAKEIFAIDFSDYEGAQILHDMNRPIPAALVSSFDLVLDGGTLEHIFDLATALRNATRMVRLNGRFISLTQANNFCGHGFYQFSPELYYRFLCPENGYVTEYCIIWEDIPRTPFYQVPDPDSVQARINLTSEFGTYMIVQALRSGDVLQEFIPQQSDYVRQWEGKIDGAGVSDGVFGKMVKLRSALKRIPSVRPAVMSALAVAQYRRLGIRRNPGGLLTPLKDLHVLR